MSGTSIDGIDIVYVNFILGKEWRFSILAAQTFPYTKSWQKKLSELHLASEEIIIKENKNYTSFLAKTILLFIRENNLFDIDAVCSHGHTLFHQPEKRYTFQMGNEKKLAELIGCQVVCDFRIQDMLLGGQGAPLVPVGDLLLFNEYDACLNLGGFANTSKTEKDYLIAYDICAVNTVLNILAQKNNLKYDDGGSLAKTGNLIIPLLEKLQALDFYRKSPPKSLGIEWVRAEIYPILGYYKDQKTEDLLHTYTKHVGKQIGESFEKDQKVLATGGGVKNNFLMQLIKENSYAKFITPSEELVDFKEALIFGLLGVLRLRDEINCFASVTGCSNDHSTGVIFQP
tara:strand:- start:766 stop:1794 length:1029 start_codon:yes stop_codon:yes gene_type:complete